MIRRLIGRGGAAGVALAAATALLLPQSAWALTLYSEGFEAGALTWSRSGAQTVDCTVAHTGYCSLKNEPTTTGTYEHATGTVAVPLTNRFTAVEFWFSNASTGGDWDSAFTVTLDCGSIEYNTTEGINNGVSLHSSHGSSQWGFASWSANTWHRGTLVFDSLTKTVSASLNGGSTVSTSYCSTATRISAVGTYVVGWSGYGSTIWYDDVSITT
ncbi:MAG TPA: hypothetical protein VF519_05035 [Mycobacteriales bacterium]|jgi:hypothetical protein